MIFLDVLFELSVGDSLVAPVQSTFLHGFAELDLSGLFNPSDLIGVYCVDILFKLGLGVWS